MYRDQWTGGLVRAELVRLFQTVEGPGIAIFSPTANKLEPLAGTPMEGLWLVEQAGECLGRHSDDCHKLLAWARAHPEREWAYFCGEMGWKPRNSAYAVKRASARVAACLNDAFRAELKR